MDKIKFLLNNGYTFFDISSLFGVRSIRFLKKVKNGLELPSKSFDLMMHLEIEFLLGAKNMKEINFDLANELGIRHATLKPYSNWVHPTAEEIKTLCNKVGTSSEVGALLGTKGRSVRKWVGGVQEIPYSVWACLVKDAGIGIIWRSNGD